jgi:hypothetical protein
MAFKSKFEEQIITQLSKAKKIVEYEPIKLDYTIDGKYIPDLRLPNGIIVELKGRFWSKDQTKMRAVKAAHPNLDIRFVFQNAGSKVDYRKMTCAEYAIKYGFKYADGAIPLAWFDE